MRLLLDECIPRKLKNHSNAHQCATVPEAGLAGQKNGELLMLAERAGFQVFITVDQGFPYQQNLSSAKLGIVVIKAPSNRLTDLAVYLPEVVQILQTIRAGELVQVGK
jgi:predicted nuclease of predicted toxin-antitoxin system